MDDKCFLVNLNADPALNELLVYYLKVTRKRSPDRPGVPRRVLQQLQLFFSSCARRNTPAWARQIRRTSSCAGWPFKLSTASSTWQRATGWCSVLCTTPGVYSVATTERGGKEGSSQGSPKSDHAFLWFFILSGHTSMVPQSPARSSFITATESCGGTTTFLGL